jgi:hypothetical protein
MFSVFAILIYMAAMAIPAWLLYHFGSEHWYWHALAVLTGLLLGFVPLPPAFSNAGYDLVLGFVFVFLMVWGIGGLFLFRPHHEKHA